jgi:hypothetical protein
MSGSTYDVDASSFLRNQTGPLSKVTPPMRSMPMPSQAVQQFLAEAGQKHPGYSDSMRPGKTGQFIDSGKLFQDARLASEVFPIPADCLKDLRSPLSQLGHPARLDGRAQIFNSR